MDQHTYSFEDYFRTKRELENTIHNIQTLLKQPEEECSSAAIATNEDGGGRS